MASNCEMNPLEPWGDPEKICCTAGLEGEELEQAILEARIIATETLNILTGDQFGFHVDRFMPCARGCKACECDPCSCCKYDRLFLPRGPVCSISKIVVGCESQDLSNYRLDNALSGAPAVISLAGEWEANQCYTDFCDPDDLESYSSGAGWWIEYIYGRPVPLMGHLAANALACEFLYSCFEPGKCTLPAGTSSVSRQGVTVSVTDAASFFDSGLTGIAMADRFIRLYNPYGLRDSAWVASPRSRGVVRPGCRQ